MNLNLKRATPYRQSMLYQIDGKTYTLTEASQAVGVDVERFCRAWKMTRDNARLYSGKHMDKIKTYCRKKGWLNDQAG